MSPTPEVPTGQTKWVILANEDDLDKWITQIRRMCSETNCLDVLVDNSVASAPVYYDLANKPDPRLQLRIENAANIILRSVKASLFAYMRVLGHTTVDGVNPTTMFQFAQRAARRIGRVDTAEQAWEETEKMVHEWRTASIRTYPCEITLKKARDWLERKLRIWHKKRKDARLDGVIAEMDRAQMNSCEPEDPGRNVHRSDSDGRAQLTTNNDNNRADDAHGHGLPSPRTDSASRSPSVRQIEGGGGNSSSSNKRLRSPRTDSASRSPSVLEIEGGGGSSSSSNDNNNNNKKKRSRSPTYSPELDPPRPQKLVVAQARAKDEPPSPTLPSYERLITPSIREAVKLEPR